VAAPCKCLVWDIVFQSDTTHEALCIAAPLVELAFGVTREADRRVPQKHWCLQFKVHLLLEEVNANLLAALIRGSSGQIQHEGVFGVRAKHICLQQNFKLSSGLHACSEEITRERKRNRERKEE
jgi:hypothetical protein